MGNNSQENSDISDNISAPIDLASAGIEDLHAKIMAIGNKQQCRNANELLAEYSALPDGFPSMRNVVRHRMITICASAAWDSQFEKNDDTETM